MRRMDFSAAVVMVMWGWIIVVSSLGRRRAGKHV
jgi:hypothetical protein